MSDHGSYPPPPGGGFPPPGYQQAGYGYTQGAMVPAQLAGFWIRFGASVIDGLILSVPNFILRQAMFSDRRAGFTIGVGITPGAAFGYQILTLLIALLYYGLQEGSASGQTVGKRVCGIRVVDAPTARPGIGVARAAGRNLMSIVSGIPLGLGYLWMLWDKPLKQTWHDKVARTTVVRG